MRFTTTSTLLAVALVGGQESLLVRSENNNNAAAKSDDDGFWQCALDSEAVTSSDPHLKTALLKFASSFDIATKVTTKSVHINVDFSQETRRDLFEACSKVGGYYAEAKEPIVCTSENPKVGGTVIQTMVGAANCAAYTDACRSSDIVLDGLKGMYNDLGGNCAYRQQQQQRHHHHALRGTRRLARY